MLSSSLLWVHILFEVHFKLDWPIWTSYLSLVDWHKKDVCHCPKIKCNVTGSIGNTNMWILETFVYAGLQIIWLAKVVKVIFVYYKTNQLVFLLSVCEYTLFAVENVQKKFY